MGRQVRRFCKTVSGARREGFIDRQQAKTLIGQAKHGDIEGARRGLIALTRRR